MNAKTTGEFIAKLRKEKNYTQKDLAQRLNVSDKAVSRWETGKGFPETTLLEALSRELEVSIGEILSGQRMEPARAQEQADKVIVESLHRADKTVTRANWVILVTVAVLIFSLVIGFLLVRRGQQQTAREFVSSSIPMHYKLGTDNKNPNTLYPGFQARTFEGGYEYYAPDGTARYVFTQIPGLSDVPVMSYMHCSTPGTKLFGIAIGEPTMVQANPVLGIDKDYSLMEYLEDQGFVWQYDEFFYGRRSLVYLDGERCNWLFYCKENVYIGLLVSAFEGRRLYGFDVGFLDTDLEAVLQQEIHGFRLILEDPQGIVQRELEEVYLPGTSITLHARKPEGAEEKLYLYVNGSFVCEFEASDDIFWPLQAQFQMLSQETTVRVTAEKP